MYQSGDESFEKMLIQAANSLDNPAINVAMAINSNTNNSNSNQIDKTLTRDRIRKSQELRRVQEEKEDEESRAIGYLGGLNLKDEVKTIESIYNSPHY